MSLMAVVHIALEIWGIVFCILCASCVYMGRMVNYRTNIRLLKMLLLNALLLCMDVMAWAFRGDEGTLGYIMVRLSNGMVFASCNLLLLAFFQYVVGLIDEKRGVGRIWYILVYGLGGAGIFGCLLNQFFPIFYDFDVRNFYYRKDWFFVLQAMGLLGMLVCGVMIIYYRKRISRNRIVALLSYIFLPAAAVSIQLFYYGIALLNLAITISVLWIFMNAQVEYMRELVKRTNELVEQEKKTGEMQMRLVLSQIQPHFLYNVLNTIYYLCGTSPGKAQKAVSHFSDYLRVNLDSVKSNVPVPIAKELEHVANYLVLEKMRFEEELNIQYDLQADGFMLPALSVQLLVENAVKHGLSKKNGGGTITITTREEENSFEVCIVDDGIGFEVGNVPDDGRSHTGIENVRTRVRIMCNGTLEIVSKPGSGTTACIHLPKQ